MPYVISGFKIIKCSLCFSLRYLLTVTLHDSCRQETARCFPILFKGENESQIRERHSTITLTLQPLTLTLGRNLKPDFIVLATPHEKKKTEYKEVRCIFVPVCVTVCSGVRILQRAPSSLISVASVSGESAAPGIRGREALLR